MATAVENKHIFDFHDQRFNLHRQRAHEFVRDDLAMSHIIGLGRLAIIHEDHASGVAATLGRSSWGKGEYDPFTLEAVVTAEPDMNNEAGASHALVSGAVHEYTHSGTLDKAEIGEHTFWLEALAGLGEALYLKDLADRGKRARVRDGFLRRAGVDLWVPGAFRYYDNDDSKTANSSQGLMAASAFALSRQRSGVSGKDVLAASHPQNRGHVAMMKASFDQLKPGLSKEIETFPQTTDGIVQATAAVQHEARKQGMSLPLRR